MSTFQTTHEDFATSGNLCSGQAIYLVGQLQSLTRREAADLIEERGGRLVEDEPTLIVLCEDPTFDQSEEATELARQTGAELVEESEFIERLGLVGTGEGVSRLYTTAMLAGLVGVPISAIRRWERRAHLQPCERMNRLAYYDFREVKIAQQLTELFTAGCSLDRIDRMIDHLAKSFVDCERPLVDLPLTVEDGTFIVRDGEALTEPSGQRLFGFDEVDEVDEHDHQANGQTQAASSDILAMPSLKSDAMNPKQRARELQEEGLVSGAIECWRTGMLQEGATADDHFSLAELLYESGDAAGAKERYYAALELDPEFLEARVNLGCVLSDLGDQQLAVAAFQGAIEQYEPFADAHYHLAVALDQLDQNSLAERHWCRFLEIAPDSPWAEEARERLS